MTVFEKNNAIETAFSKIELVAAYVRVSTQEQKLHGLSLDAQKMKLTEYAEENNMRIVEWYVDEGVSGRKLIKNRPELQRMIQDAEKGKFDRIIFIKLDRFFRSVAEYHECMKRIAPVVWTTTEEDYDLTTANGRMLVNMKLTIAELEADQTGERIKIVNEYKVQTGQPLVGDGSQPFGFKNAIDPETGRKKIIRNPEEEPILRDALDHYMTHQSKKKTVVYLHTKHHVSIPYNSLTRLLQNTMLCGEYRDNKNYCEAYMTREQFDKLQDLMKRNVKCNTEKRDYLFSGLIKCPHCGRRLAGNTSVLTRKSGKKYIYKRYRCHNNIANGTCEFGKSVSESTLEKLMLENIEHLLEGVKIGAVEVTDSGSVIAPEISVEDIYVEIDRLNYSWKTGKIRTVEKYEEDYAELMEMLEKAQAEQGQVVVKDFSKIEAILHEGWKAVYENLDDAYKRAFWRSFVQAIEISWDTNHKEINNVIFF
jgi:DNA invertase Pin-like site-specific DNA recombinase